MAVSPYRVVLDGSGNAIEALTVAISPTPTVVIPATRVTMLQHVFVALQNLDGSQTLSAQVQTGPSSTGPWRDSGRTELALITPVGGGDEYEELVLQVLGSRYVRVSATASGAGLNCKAWAYVTDGVP